ncbi:recombinase family protein [Salipiger sp. 1_MG-2023]|uniref:recombinase family protein n=1 Tax=Salipiger sp. 1_MG-2023 TaxID=3062665 RepID=UPI0026E1A9C6|nr:recombinase family protein [Salipiger sp. 1_MG-2023]MDO6588560.1 recombinase family protein [Salipiger sp. 1_MG-2023]
MKIGYARTSTSDQTAGLDAQHRDLSKAGCEKIFAEKVSSVDKAHRAKLAEALEFCRDGDTLVITKLDRLARSTQHLLSIVEDLESKGVSLEILAMGIDTGTPTGRLMLTMLGGVAEFERNIMLERQREGIAKAKAEGKYKGRQPTARTKADEMRRLSEAGKTRKEIAEALGVSERSVYRVLSTAEAIG